MKNYKFIVSGRVQGVFYRKTTCENSQKNAFLGYVKNLSNGDVEACVTCTDQKLEKFINILQEGSTNSEVTNIVKQECNETFTNKFEIRY